MASNLAMVSSTELFDSTYFDQELDARGLSCPLPILSTRRSFDGISAGEVLKVVSTDPGCVSFFESLVRQTGLELLSWNESDGEFSFFLRKN